MDALTFYGFAYTHMYMKISKAKRNASNDLKVPVHSVKPRGGMRVRTGIQAGRLFDSQNQHYQPSQDTEDFDI